MIDNNSTSERPTHFLAATQLIKEARNTYNICSENWTYPTDYRLGDPRDPWYAEVWSDGMDWNYVLWVIEKNNYSNPKVYPLIIFENDKEKSKFNPFDFKELILALLDYRRDTYWIHSNDFHRFRDTVWPYLSTCKSEKLLWECEFKHASQPLVKFLINKDFLPLSI